MFLRALGLAERPVVDRTDMAGDFAVDLTWTAERAAAQPVDAVDPPRDRDDVSIYTALREQLGLKLESRKNTIEVLVVDRAEHPVEQ